MFPNDAEHLYSITYRCGTPGLRQREVEGDERGQHQARIPGPPGGMAGDSPVRQAGQQAHVRPAVLLQFF